MTVKAEALRRMLDGIRTRSSVDWRKNSDGKLVRHEDWAKAAKLKK